jgi:4'-phosphopantetheinyl transferase
MLAPNVIQVWFASTSSCGDSALSDLAWLSSEERRRAHSFRFDKDRRVFVLGKRVVRTVLGRALGRPPEAVVFAAKPKGKPELAPGTEPSGLAFNLAHSGTEVVCAIAFRRYVGVDIEQEREVDPLELAGRFFCGTEIRQLEAAPPGERRRLFFKYWTLKEAYLKAEGSGLGISLRAIDVSDVPDRLPCIPSTPIEDRPREILVQPIEASPGYVAAVAAQGPSWNTETRVWRASEFGCF